MPNETEFAHVFSRFMKARIPFVTINSGERTRVRRLLTDVAKKLDMSFQYHSLTEGVRDLRDGRAVSDERDIVGALDMVTNQLRTRDGITFVFSDAQDLGADGPISRQFFDVVTLAEQRSSTIVVVTTDAVWTPLQRLGMTVSLDAPDFDEMTAMMQRELGHYERQGVKVRWDDNDRQRATTTLSGLSEIEAQNLMASLIANRYELDRSDLGILAQEKDQIFSNLAGIERVKVNPDDTAVGGLENLRDWLEQEKYFLTADLRERGLRPPRGVLLVGVPGCGKSLSAKAVANAWELSLYRLDMGAIMGQYVGQSEGRLREAFDAADHVAPCVLWIDEIEKALGAGSTDSTGVTQRLIGQFLYWLQESVARVFVVATANDVSLLPAELLRRGRFDELFFVDLPNREERREITRIYLRRYVKAPVADAVIEDLVTLSEGFTGADLESAIRIIGKHADRVGDDKIDPSFCRDAVHNVVPLSKTNPERIQSIRSWCQERAVPASRACVDVTGADDRPVGRMLLLPAGHQIPTGAAS